MSTSLFWDQRFAAEGKIWGEAPSSTVEPAVKLFRDAGVNTVLVPGCGYRRNACALAREGFAVTGLELSANALAMARQCGAAARWIEGSVLDVAAVQGPFDAVFAQNLLHLFLAPERRKLVQNCRLWLRPGGMIYAAVFADTDFTYGRGRQIEPHTFESRPGRPARYFSDPDLREHFSAFEVVDCGVIEEPENHPPDGEHVHQLRYVVARKAG